MSDRDMLYGCAKEAKSAFDFLSGLVMKFESKERAGTINADAVLFTQDDLRSLVDFVEAVDTLMAQRPGRAL